MSKLSLTKRTLIKMLCENTGSHMLDSGGAYGRNFERNAHKDFEASPEATAEFSIYDDKLSCSITLNVYHWLAARLNYRPDMQAQFTRFANRPENKDESWFTTGAAYMDHLVETKDATGLYGDGKPMTVNTYNGEDSLSQVIQYTYFEIDRDAFVLLQIHGGCDVRGGYTKPMIFEAPDECSIFDNARVTLSEEGRDGFYWDSDDGGYRWEAGEYSHDKDLFGKEWSKAPDLEKMPVTNDQTLLGDGVHIVVTEDGKAYSPRGRVLAAHPMPC
jgi:hypothetical protein